MKKIILTTFILFSSSNLAHDLPNTFEAGQPIVASEVNENFAELKSEITGIKNQLKTKILMHYHNMWVIVLASQVVALELDF